MNSVHSFGLFPRAPRFLPQRIAGSGYEIDLASSAITKLYYAMLKIANCVSKVGHLQLALVVGSKTKSTDVFNVLLG